MAEAPRAAAEVRMAVVREEAAGARWAQVALEVAVRAATGAAGAAAAKMATIAPAQLTRRSHSTTLASRALLGL